MEEVRGSIPLSSTPKPLEIGAFVIYGFLRDLNGWFIGWSISSKTTRTSAASSDTRLRLGTFSRSEETSRATSRLNQLAIACVDNRMVRKSVPGVPSGSGWLFYSRGVRKDFRFLLVSFCSQRLLSRPVVTTKHRPRKSRWRASSGASKAGTAES